MPNSINITNNLTSTSIPELYIRYFNPKININTDIIIPYYVSDSTQEEFLRNTNTKSFTTIVKIGNNTFSQTTNAGEHSINIGSISTTGETYFSIYTIDENGVASIEQFFDILIIDNSYTITSSQTYTMVESDLTKHNIVVGESVSNTVAQSNNTGLNNLFNEVKNNGYRKIIMLNRIYMLDYHGSKVMPPTEFTIDMNNATFKATQCTDINVANLVDLRDCFDTHVINGKLVGNYDGFDFATTQSTTGYYIPGEGLAVAEMNGAKYSSFENMDMSYSVGYNLGVFGGKDAGYIGSPGSLKFSNAYYINGNNTVNSDILSTTDLIDITGLLDRGEIQCSVYLNYGGLKLNKAELFIHFYNSSSNYMTTIKTRQYQIVKIPNGATQIRVTGFTASSTDNSGLSICHTGYSKNCGLINIKSHNTRTCAMHPGIYNHLLIKDCTFNRVADENEYKVTKLALDFEDGYENGRNLFFINNEVYEGTSALTIQRCFNANIIRCRNFGLDTRGHIKGAYIKNNFFNNGDIYTTNFDSQSHLKLINNTFFKTLNFLKWDDTGNYDSIGLTELDCKNGYTNNKNCTLFIRNESSSSGGSGGTDTPSSYTITNNLTNCTTNNNNESVSSNSNYTATITANSGYVMASIVVTMGGADISDTAVSGNNINISSVTGNIVITAVASEQAEVLPNITLFDNGLTEGYIISNGANYEVSNVITLNNGSNTYFGFDQSITFNKGDSISFIINTCGSDSAGHVTRVCYLDDSNQLQGYETAVTDDVVSANLPYKLTHTFNSKVTIKPALMKYFGNITVSKIYVTRAGSIDDTTYYSIVNNLTNCTNNNNSVTVSNNSSYSATITPNNNYIMNSITVTMGGTNITSSAVNGNNINISNVTGNIVITANTSIITYTITNNLTNCTTNNSNTSISINSSYSATITPNDEYTISSITITMGGTDISDTAVSDNVISISSVTGNIVITAVALKQVEVVSETVLFDNGLAEGYTISKGANYTVGDKITLNHGANTYFGFDQSVTFNAGDSISFVIDTCGSNASGYITRVCWLDDNNALQGYETAVTDDVVSANLPYTLTHTFNSTTTIKPALMKYFGNITISKVYITTTEVVIGEQPLYKFGLLSDVHIDGDGTDTAHSISDLTNAISFLESAGASFIAYTGDMTYNGRTEDYTALKTCLETSIIPNYCVRGNHDAYSLSDGYASATGCKEDYIVTQGNDLLIFISCADTNHDTGGLTTNKLDWLENLLQTNTNTRVFLFYHYFVNGTSGNGTGVYPYGTLNPSNAIALRFINMVKQYPNLIYCNGHSHMRFNIQDKDVNANYYHNDGECYYIHVPSTAKPRFPSGDTVADYYEGSEGYLVEVYADKVLFKPIDFISSEYLTKYNYTANVSQGNNAPTVPSVPDTPSTIDITWNNGVKIDRSTGAESSDVNYSASNFIACDTSKTYTLNWASSVPASGRNVFACYYDESQSFISCSSEFIGSYHGSSDVYTAELSLPSNAKYIKLRLYAVTDASAMDKSIITLTATSTTPSEPTEPSEPTTPTITWNNGVKIDRSTGAETSDVNYSASNFIACDSSKTYTLNLASSMSSHAGNVFICYYDENKSFISCSDNFIGSYSGSSEVFTTGLSFPSNAKYIKLRLYADNNGITAIDKSIITLNVTEVATNRDLTLNYAFNNETAGNGYGTISLLANSDDTAGTYTIQYADNNGALSNYDNICTLTVTNGVQADYTHFIKEQMIPKYATKIIAVKDNQTKAEFVIPENKRFTSGNYGQHLYSFGAISDLHTSLTTWNTDFQEALTYFNDKESAVFTCIAGDITQGGTEEQFQRYKNLKDTYSPSIPVYATNGNHELNNSSFGDTLWDTYMDNKRTCLFTQGNDVFIMLGIEKSPYITFGQKQWLESQLERFSNCRVFIFCHYFIKGTDNGGYTGWNKDSNFSTTNAQGQWLLGLLQQYKNVFYVSGHSHLKFILQELNHKENICNEYNSNEIGYLWHLASITAPRDVIDGSVTGNLTAESEGVVVDVYENCILFRGRNFVDKKFLPIAQYIIPKTEGTLPDTSVYTVKTTLQNATSSNTVTSVAKNSSYTTTITATDGYSINKITVIMGITDISNTAVSGNTITIDSVTDDLIIKVVTINSASEVITPTWMNGGIASATGQDITDPEGMRSSYMEFDTNAYTYYITVTNEFEGIDKLRVAIYNPDGSFVVRQSYTSTSLTPGVPGAITFPVTSGKFRLKVDFKLTNTLENINSRLVITKVPKEPSESIPGQIIFNWETGSIDGSTGLDESMSSAMRTNYVEFDTNSYNYYITVTDEYDVNCSTKIYFYNPDGSFKSRKSYSPTSLVVGETESIPFPITTGTFRVRTNYGETNTAENINSRIIITKVPVASAII